MKHSIEWQMTVAFMSLLAFMFVVILLGNAWLLEPYYIRDKKSKFISMYESLSQAAEEGRLAGTDEATYAALARQAEKDNLFFLTINMAEQTMTANVQHEVELKQYLDAYLLNRRGSGDKTLELTENYEISQTKGNDSAAEYLMMRGELGGGYFFLIQSPLESIQGSAALANRFLIAVGSVAAVICMLLVWLFSKKITNPLRELADISEKMAELNFETKYTSGGEDEIGVLGENFNRMAERLERSISELKSANNRLMQDLEQRDKLEQMRSEFLGNVSHELKTPIALIQGYAEGLKEGIDTDAESREFYCDVIIDEVSKMNHMVRNLLALNQLEFGDEEIQFERFDLTELAAGVLESMELFAEQTKAKVQFLTTEPVYVWADEYRGSGRRGEDDGL